MKRIAGLVAGYLCLGLGLIGLVLPVWPTTPFILLAVGCFSSSPRLRARILRIRFIREHYENYKERKGLPRKTLVVSLLFLWGLLSVSLLCMQNVWLRLGLGVIGAAVTIHLLWMAKSRRKPPSEAVVFAPKS